MEQANTWVRDPSADAFLLPLMDTLAPPPLPRWIRTAPTKEEGWRRLDLFVRMLYSALVDADFLDTEGYFARAGSSEADAKVFASSTVSQYGARTT